MGPTRIDDGEPRIMRPRSWRTRVAAAHVVALAATMLAVTRPAPALAADTVSCAAQTSVFAAATDGTLWRYPLNSPGSATSSWSARVSAGGGWNTYGRVIGGPDG